MDRARSARFISARTAVTSRARKECLPARACKKWRQIVMPSATPKRAGESSMKPKRVSDGRFGAPRTKLATCLSGCDVRLTILSTAGSDKIDNQQLMATRDAHTEVWPALPFEEWKETCATLHMWTQIVGKIRLSLAPWTNHSWHVTLYLTARGLTTSPIPHRSGTFEIRFDFIDHQLHILKSDGGLRSLELKPRSVADFYKAVMTALDELKLPVKINVVPNEVADAIPFDRNEQHRSYD